MSQKPGGSIGLVLHPRRDPKPVADKIVRWARSQGSELLVDARDAARVPDDVRAVDGDQLTHDVDALVSLGGDGTMLGALRLVADRPVPVLGVNLGQVGFLAEVEPTEVDGALDRLGSGEYTIEHHSALAVSVGQEAMIAFNDVVLGSVPGEGQVHAAAMLAERPGGRYRCDALVIATPIGSTAYSYAAGGPVVSPALDAVIVTPVAPVSGIARTAVVSAMETIRLTILEESGRPALEVDGSVLRRMDPGETVEVRLRPQAGQVVRLDADRYQRRSAVKLSLMDLPFLPHEMRDLASPADPVSPSAEE